MRTVSLLYTISTKKLSITSAHSGNEAIGGTYGDNNATTVHIAYSGTLSGYTAALVVGAHVETAEHTVYTPEYSVPASGDIVLPGYVMSSALNGQLPLQLHFTASDSSEEFYSENQVVLRILPALAEAQELSSTPDLSAYAKVIRTASLDTNSTATEYSYEYSLGFMPSSVTVLEKGDDNKLYEADVGLRYDTNKVTLIFAEPPGVKTFWIKVIV